VLAFHLCFEPPSFSADAFYSFIRYPMRASCFTHNNNNNNNNNISTHILSTLFLLKLERC